MPEPLGGAHRDADATAATVKRALGDALARIEKGSTDQLLAARHKRLMSYGAYEE